MAQQLTITQKFISDGPNILLAAMAGLTCYLLYGLANSFVFFHIEMLAVCTFMGAVGGVIPTLWEILSTSQGMARLSHSWLMVGIVLALLQMAIRPALDALWFGYLFHLFLDAQTHKLVPISKITGGQRHTVYVVIAVIYFVLILYAVYASSAPLPLH